MASLEYEHLCALVHLCERENPKRLKKMSESVMAFVQQNSGALKPADVRWLKDKWHKLLIDGHRGRATFPLYKVGAYGGFDSEDITLAVLTAFFLVVAFYIKSTAAPTNKTLDAGDTGLNMAEGMDVESFSQEGHGKARAEDIMDALMSTDDSDVPQKPSSAEDSKRNPAPKKRSWWPFRSGTDSDAPSEASPPSGKKLPTAQPVQAGPSRGWSLPAFLRPKPKTPLLADPSAPPSAEYEGEPLSPHPDRPLPPLPPGAGLGEIDYGSYGGRHVPVGGRSRARGY
jgi:hypothetical protein